MTKPSVSVIVPVYSADAYLDAMFRELFLDGLKRNSVGLDIELVIVDDRSPLAAAAAAGAASAWASVKYLRNEKNLGLLRSANRGLQAASGDLLLLCNSDTRFVPGALGRLIAAAEERPLLGMLGPVTNGAFGALAQTVNPKLALTDFSRPELDRIDAFGASLPAGGPAVEVRWLIGFCMLIKRDLLTSVGLFDEKLGFGYEEQIDYAIRARRAGWKIFVDKSAFVFHGGLKRPYYVFPGARNCSQSSRTVPLRKLYWVFRNAAYMIWKYGWKELSQRQEI